jgi:hypothetical protein
MVDALMRQLIPAHLAAHKRAPMRAAVDERVQRAGFVAGDDDRRIAEKRCLEIAGPRQFRRQGDEIPVRAGEDFLLLAPVDIGVGKEPIWDPRRDGG